MKDDSAFTVPIDDPVFPPRGGGQYAQASKEKSDVVPPEQPLITTEVVAVKQPAPDVSGRAHIAVDEEEKKTRPIFWVIMVLIEIVIAVGGSILILSSRG